MKIPVLLFILCLPALHAAPAQSASPAARSSFFGSTSATGSSAADATADAATSSADGTAPANGKARATPDPKATGGDPAMKEAADLLKIAKDRMQSTTSTTPKADALPIVVSARDAVKKTSGDGRYRGHRAKALKRLDETIAELKAGDHANQAAGGLTEAIAEVYNCVGLAR